MSRENEKDASPAGGSGPGDEGLAQAFFRDRNLAEAGTGPGDSRKSLLLRLAVWILPLLLLLALLDAALRKLFPPLELLPYLQKEIAFLTLKVDRFREAPPPDVLFIGSSRMRDAVIPSVFAADLSAYLDRPVKAFNLGLGGAQAEEYYALAASHMPEPPPPYVVLGFSGTEVARVQSFAYASRFLWRLPNFLSYLNRTSFQDINEKHIEYFIESLICRFWYLFAYRDALARRIAEPFESFLGRPEDAEKKKQEEDQQRRIIANVLAEDGYNPFLPEFTSLEGQLKSNPRAIRKGIKKWELDKDPDLFSEKTVLLLRRIVSSLREKGCKVALVETPPSPYMQALNPVMHGPGFRKFMFRAAKEIDVPFLAFPPWDTGLDNAFYGDLSHLSKAGAELYSHCLFHRLRTIGFFDEEGP